MRLTFKGGVHPFEGERNVKGLARWKKILLPKADLAVIHCPSTLVLRRSLWLQRGDHVLAGR